VLDLVHTHVAGDTSETIDGEGAVIVIDFKDGTHCLNRLFVLVETAKVM
jgi:hypothetical protein